MAKNSGHKNFIMKCRNIDPPPLFRKYSYKKNECLPYPLLLHPLQGSCPGVDLLLPPLHWALLGSPASLGWRDLDWC